MKKFYSFIGVLGTAALSLIPYGCGDKGPKETQEVPRQDTPKYVAPAPVKDTIKQEPSSYVVQKGDFLSSIMYDELGLRGDSIYKELLENIQPLNYSPEEIKRRDIVSVIDGKLVNKPDGLVDTIFPGEEIRFK